MKIIQRIVSAGIFALSVVYGGTLMAADMSTTPTPSAAPTTTNTTIPTSNPIVVPKSKPIPQYTISFISPTSEETFQSSTMEMTVVVDVKPPLEKEDTVAIFVDGSQSGEAVNSTTITIPPLERGSHTLQAKIFQPKGKGAESETITIYQQRHSRLLP